MIFRPYRFDCFLRLVALLFVVMRADDSFQTDFPVLDDFPGLAERAPRKKLQAETGHGGGRKVGLLAIFRQPEPVITLHFFCCKPKVGMIYVVLLSA